MNYAKFDFVSHDMDNPNTREGLTDQVIFERRPAKLPDGSVADGLYNAWIILNNPSQYNSYNTDMVKSVILAFRAASNARAERAHQADPRPARHCDRLPPASGWSRPAGARAATGTVGAPCRRSSVPRM